MQRLRDSADAAIRGNRNPSGRAITEGFVQNRMTVTACDVNRLLRTAQRKRDSVDGGDRRLRNGASTIAIAALAPNLSQFAGDLRVTL